MERDIVKILDKSYISIAALTCIVHIIGLVVLIRVKSPNANQKFIVINLAFTEMLFCLNQVIHFAWKGLAETANFKRTKATMTLRLFFFTTNKVVMLCLILDRFFDILLNLKYALYFTKKKIVTVMVVAWTTCAIYSVTVGVLDSLRNPLEFPKLHKNVNIYVSLVLDALIVICATTTYLYFYLKVKAILRKRHCNSTNQAQSSSFKFTIPFLLVATYVVFNVAGTLMVEFSGEGRGTYQRPLRLSGWNLVAVSYLSDGLLYVFLQKNVRRYIIDGFSKNILRRDITNSDTYTV